MIRYLVPVCLLVMLVSAGIVAFVPSTRGSFHACMALLAFAVARIAAGQPLWRKPPNSMLLIAAATLALIPGIVIQRLFRDIDTSAFVFHAQAGIAGTPFSAYRKELLAALASTSVMVMASWLLVAHLRPRWVLVATVSAGLVLANPLVRAFVHDRLNFVPSDLAERLIEAPRLLAKAPNSRPDILILYLEGTDRQFADPALWPGLYDPLAALAAEGVSFTRIGQLRGTGWSIAGMVATQCGVPLIPNGFLFHNDLDKVQSFLPSLTCLGDLLVARGYRTAFVVGGEEKFGGIGPFYRTHGFPALDDKSLLSRTYPDDLLDAASNGWVYDDQLVLEHATRRFEQLASGSDPFLMVVETYGPHDEKGLLSRRCADDGRATLSRDVRAAVTCMLSLTDEFLERARERHADLRPGHELRIVVFSDHLNHSKYLPKAAPDFDGFNTVILVGGKIPKGREIATPGTMVDVYPTLLEWLDLAGPNAVAGLGRGLWSGKATLSSEIGLERMNAMLRTDAALGALLWTDPSRTLGANDPVGAVPVLYHAESG